MTTQKKPKNKVIALAISLLLLMAAATGFIDDGSAHKPLEILQSVLQTSENPEETSLTYDAGMTAISADELKYISPERARHILQGDQNGGGHKYGANKPCKSEFPQDWDDVKIIKTIDKIAANDNLNWKQQDNGYYVAETMEGTLKIRVVLDRERDDVVTAYPVNVRRNYCPPAANDNYNR